MGQRNIVGLVADRNLAELINSAGYQVLGGPDFQGAAKRISESGNAPALLVVVDQQAPGFGPWLEQQAMTTPVVLIPSEDGSLGAHHLAIPLPTTVEAILARAGLPVSGGRAHESIGLGGVIGAAVPVVAPPTQSFPQPSLSAEPAEVLGDPDFIPEPIPVLTDDDAPFPSAAPLSVPIGALPTPGGGSPTPPAWNSEAVTPPQQPSAPVEAAPSFLPAQPAGPAEPVSSWGGQASAHPEARHSAVPVTPQLPSASPAPWMAPQQEFSAPSQQPYMAAPPQMAQEAPQQMPQQAPQMPQQSWPGHQQYQEQAWQPQHQPQHQPQQSWNQFHPHDGSATQPFQQQQQPFRQSDFRDQRSAFMQESVRATQDATVLVSWAAKGGVGKTSLTIATAQIAGEAGLTVLVIDANRGQASIRHNLRVDGLPTIYDARDGGAHKAIVTKDVLVGRRPAARGPVHFDVILGPPEDFAGPENTPASLYASVLSESRRHYDLIVIDTQILEAEGDMTDVWGEFLIPQLRSGGWGVGIFDESPTGLDHLDERLSMLNARFEISNARMLSVSNMWDQFTDDDAAHVSQMFAGRATLLGSIENDPSFRDRLTAGFIPTDATGVTPVIRQLLHQITGRPEFQLIEQEPSRMRRLFRRSKKK